MDSPLVKNSDKEAQAKFQHDAEEVYRRAGIVTLYTLLSRILGMARDLVLAHRFGASGAIDAWVQAFRLPNMLRRLTAEGAMTIAFVPLYTKVLHENGKQEARDFAARILGAVLLVTVLLSGFGFFFSEAITAVSSPGFLADPNKFALSARILRWSFPYLIMVSLVAWAMGVLHVHGHFAAPAAAPAFLNLGIIGAVLCPQGWISPPVMAVTVGVLVGGVAQVLLQCPVLIKKQISFKPLFSMDRHVRQLFYLLGPALFGIAVYQLNIILLGALASFLPTGQIFHYYNATRLTELVLGLFTFAFSTAGLPTLSGYMARKDWQKVRSTISLTLSASLYPLLPAMVGFIVASQAIVAMLYLHGEFQFKDVISTAGALQWMSLGVPAIAAVRVMTPVFYAYGDTKYPVLAALANMMVTIPSGWFLSRRYMVAGLAGALSLGVWVQCLLLWWMLSRKTGASWTPWRAIFRQVLAAVLVGWVVSRLQLYGKWQLGTAYASNWVVLALCIACGGLGYWGLTLLMKDEQANHWLQLVKKIAAKLG